MPFRISSGRETWLRRDLTETNKQEYAHEYSAKTQAEAAIKRARKLEPNRQYEVEWV